jgi:hypothetical protein
VVVLVVRSDWSIRVLVKVVMKKSYRNEGKAGVSVPISLVASRGLSRLAADWLAESQAAV